MKNRIIAVGKRKESVARAIVKEGSGKIRINKVPYEFFPFIKRLMIEEPLEIAREKLGDIKFDIEVNVRGGGASSQIQAARLAIAKALVEATKSNELKKAYLAYDRSLLVADVRRKEQYKPGDSKARAKRQKSYR